MPFCQDRNSGYYFPLSRYHMALCSIYNSCTCSNAWSRKIGCTSAPPGLYPNESVGFWRAAKITEALLTTDCQWTRGRPSCPIQGIMDYWLHQSRLFLAMELFKEGDLTDTFFNTSVSAISHPTTTIYARWYPQNYNISTSMSLLLLILQISPWRRWHW